MKLNKMLLIVSLMTTLNCGGNSVSLDSGTDDTGGSTITAEESFSADGGALTIDDIVNTDSSGSSLTTSYVTVSNSAAFYFGRFLYSPSDSSDVFTGSIKFKLNKNDDDSAYFSDFTLLHLSQITGVDSNDSIVTSSTDLEVDAAYNSISNQVSIADANSRFVSFDVDFSDNSYFPDVENAGVLFTADFSTMVGGNDSTFFFIAQKITSQPDVSLTAINGDFDIVNFTVDNSDGAILLDSTATVTVGGAGGNGFTGFAGTNSSAGDFDGELSLTDATAGCFAFGYGSGDGTMTALGPIDGGFLLSADQNLALGIDLNTGVYFAAEQ